MPPSVARPNRTCSTTRSRRSWPRPRSAWASTTRPRLRRPRGGAAVTRRLLPAGRPRRSGGDHAEVVLLPGPRTPRSGPISPRWLPARGSGAAVPGHPRRRRPISTPALETRVDLRRTRLELMLKVLDVDGAVRRVRGGWVATGAHGPTTPRATPASPRRGPRAAGHARLRRTVECRMGFLRGCSTTPRRPCGRCDTCGGRPFAGESRSDRAEARDRPTRPGVEVEPRRSGRGADRPRRRASPDPARCRAGPGGRAADRHRLGQPAARAVRARSRRRAGVRHAGAGLA